MNAKIINIQFFFQNMKIDLKGHPRSLLLKGFEFFKSIYLFIYLSIHHIIQLLQILGSLQDPVAPRYSQVPAVNNLPGVLANQPVRGTQMQVDRQIGRQIYVLKDKYLQLTILCLLIFIGLKETIIKRVKYIMILYSLSTFKK